MPQVSLKPVYKKGNLKPESLISNKLVSKGFNEIITYSFISEADNEIFGQEQNTLSRLLNHGKHIFDAKKQKAASKKKQKRQQVKEIKFRPVTEKNDYEIKVNKIKSFIEKKNYALNIDIINDGPQVLDTGGGIFNLIKHSEEEDFLILNQTSQKYYLS